MNIENEQHFEPTVAPHNGKRVTTADLYRALYELDQGLSRRQTVIFEAINDGADRAAQLRTDFEGHREDGHPFTGLARIEQSRLSLSIKKVGLTAAIVTFLTALAVAAGVLAPMVLGG